MLHTKELQNLADLMQCCTRPPKPAFFHHHTDIAICAIRLLYRVTAVDAHGLSSMQFPSTTVWRSWKPVLLDGVLPEVPRLIPQKLEHFRPNQATKLEGWQRSMDTMAKLRFSGTERHSAINCSMSCKF